MRKYKYDVEAHKALKQAKNFCPAPFTGLYEEPDGLVKPCCVYRGPDIGNVNETSYEDLYNSPQMKSMRKDFKENKRPASCGACFNHIAEDDEESMAVNRKAAFSQTHSWQQGVLWAHRGSKGHTLRAWTLWRTSGAAQSGCRLRQAWTERLLAKERSC